MSTLATAARNAARDAINDLLEAGSAVTYPSMRFRTAGDAELMTVNLAATSPFGASSAGVATANAPITGGGAWATFSQNPTADGTAAKVVLCDRDNTVVETLSVGATGSGEEFEVSNVNFVTTSAVTTTTAPTVNIRASYDPTP